MVGNLIKDVVNTQGQLGERDTTHPVFKLLDANVPSFKGTVKLTQKDIGHAFTVGHAANGVIGVPALGTDGSQVTIGVGGLGSSTISRIKSDDNTFQECFRDTSYTDTGSTTATVDTTNFKVTF